jgi:transcriptional regulator with XRE-family HTH domain
MSEFPDHIMEYLEEVGRNIAIFRQRKGMTMQELAEDIGADRSAISKYEAGANVTLVTMLRIATALDITMPELVQTNMKVSDLELEKYTIKKKLRRKSSNPDKEV